MLDRIVHFVGLVRGCFFFVIELHRLQAQTFFERLFLGLAGRLQTGLTAELSSHRSLVNHSWRGGGLPTHFCDQIWAKETGFPYVALLSFFVHSSKIIVRFFKFKLGLAVSYPETD